MLLKPHAPRLPAMRLVRAVGRWLAGCFNRGFDRASGGYAASVGSARAGGKVIMLAIYAGLLAGTVWIWPTRCRAASFRSRTRAMPRRHAAARRRLAGAHRRGGAARHRDRRSDTPGVVDAVAFAGFSGATFTNASNAGRRSSSRFDAVRGAAATMAMTGNAHHRRALRAGCRRSRRRSSSRSRRRRCAASATPAASRSGPGPRRRRHAGACSRRRARLMAERRAPSRS